MARLLWEEKQKTRNHVPLASVGWHKCSPGSHDGHRAPHLGKGGSFVSKLLNVHPFLSPILGLEHLKTETSGWERGKGGGRPGIKWVFIPSYFSLINLLVSWNTTSAAGNTGSMWSSRKWSPSALLRGGAGETPEALEGKRHNCIHTCPGPLFIYICRVVIIQQFPVSHW